MSALLPGVMGDAIDQLENDYDAFFAFLVGSACTGQKNALRAAEGPSRGIGVVDPDEAKRNGIKGVER